MFRLTRRRVLATGAALAVSAIALAGCSSSGDNSSAQKLETDKSKISGSITFATWWSYADQKLIDGFSKEYPNVKVHLDFTAVDSYPTKLQTLASSGDLPDVFAAQGPSLVALTKAKQLYNLNDALATAPDDGDAKTWKDSFNQSLLTGANAGLAAPNKETWGVPFNAISVASIYNKDIFDKVGVTPPATFDELLSNCTKLSDAGYIPMSLTGSTWIDWWPRLAWDQTMQGDKVADFSTSNPAYVKGFELVKKMADAKCWSSSQITTDIAGETSLFLQQKTAQFVSVPENFLQSVAQGAKFNLGTYVLPAMDGKTPNRILGGGNANVIAVSAKSKNPSAAIAFAKYLTSKATETSLATTQYTIPSLDIDLNSSNPLMVAYLKAASDGFVDSSTYLPSFSTAGNTTFLTEVLPNLILGKTTPEQAAQATTNLFQK
ncbi:ABC transporter substrate-binding protein [Leifsonia sp. NPDC014704]|uniref:ABC transporter substrate-binding protein n=1 Tax=Leifsonia sp. NPDC014704 TaxID=3364123 RepID=UPI0036F4773C